MKTDSKQLPPKKREELFKSIVEYTKIQINWRVIIISAQELSERMLKMKKENLNQISHAAAIDLVKEALGLGFAISELYVDTVGNKNSYRTKLSLQFPSISSITVSEKADDKFPIVSAASICAKVLRDKELEDYVFEEEMSEEDRNYGTGYLADARSLKWMERNYDQVFGFPSMVRFSFIPAQRAMDKCSSVKWSKYAKDNEEEEVRDRQGHLNFSSRYRYFTQAELDIVQDFDK
eukprot:TRINITY_DN4699_c0_g1_i12.p1 TRINITY_DN4699_c0_g1~~TRINITY_DN4699_c0_g1_i12.p1  ORF type:complete len:235 (+),score=54.56 TRINITY_DN4699_c0_g1_i12:1080-1784(+)